MNPISPALLEQGSSYSEFRARAENNQEILDEVYESPAFDDKDLETLKRLPALQVVAIAEDWCPDVFHTLPTWARVVEQLDTWGFRVFERDRFPELMDCFLYRGGARRIPVYAFYDDGCRLQAWWSGRGAEAQAAYDGWMGGRSFGELDRSERSQIAASFEHGYRTRFRRQNFLEILALLRAFWHLGSG